MRTFYILAGTISWVIGIFTNIFSPEKTDKWGYFMLFGIWLYISYYGETIIEEVKKNQK